MRTLALRGGARVAVVAAESYDAFGVVTRGRVQLELREGEPGPVLGSDASLLVVREDVAVLDVGEGGGDVVGVDRGDQRCHLAGQAA